jgi:rhamnogalacturonyl hydrolase YesR
MKKIALFVLGFCTAGLLPSLAQQDAEAITRALADRIIRNTSFAFVNRETGERFTGTANIPYSPALAAASEYNEWHYTNGVIQIAMMRLAELSGDRKYTDYCLRNFSFIFHNLDYFRKQYEAKVPGSSFSQYFSLNKLDDCGAMSAALADVNRQDHRKEYDAYLARSVAYISRKQQRLPDGTFIRPEPRKMTLWADDLYMSVPFLARMGRNTGNSTYFDDAVKQVENFSRYLYDSCSGLYYHCWYSDVRLNGVAHWGRCNGWLMIALAELLDQLPQQHPKRRELIRILQRQITGLSRYQDSSGLWHQLLDKPDSYLETSCTAMFTYAIARAVAAGWINSSYLSIAENGWKGILSRIGPDGQVADICVGTGIADDIGFYYERPRETDDPHGLGPVLLAGIEMMRAEKNKISR